MTARDTARAILVTGWAAGVVLILCGLPLVLAVIALAVSIGAAWSAKWWHPALTAWAHSRLQKTGSEEQP